MKMDIRLPNITAATPELQISQMQSYMYQLVQQLNWALNAVDSASREENPDVELTGGTGEITQEEAQTTFNSLKSLIIKSADIVNAYYEVMKERFDGDYVASSDFGIYQETTQNEIIKNSTSIEQIYSNLQTIISDIETLEHAVIDTQAWIKSGLLEYDDQGVPIYGVEVGQKSTVDGEEKFDRFARFTSGGIYFYLPGYSDAVAWMSGTKLYITNAEITGSLKLGKYICDLTSGVAFKWVGGV